MPRHQVPDYLYSITDISRRSKILAAADACHTIRRLQVSLFLISLVSPLVDESQRARLFPSISIVDTVG
jgi:hypothetical protein